MTAGTTISAYYDSLLTKVIATAPTYINTLNRLDRALSEWCGALMRYTSVESSSSVW